MHRMGEMEFAELVYGRLVAKSTSGEPAGLAHANANKYGMNTNRAGICARG